LPVLERVLDQGQALVQGLERVLAQVRPERVQAAPAWVLDQGQALVKAALGPVARKDRTDLDPVMEPAMVVLVRQTVQALAQATEPARAALVRVAAGINADPSSPLKNAPHPAILPQFGRACRAEGISAKQ